MSNMMEFLGLESHTAEESEYALDFYALVSKEARAYFWKSPEVEAIMAEAKAKAKAIIAQQIETRFTTALVEKPDLIRNGEVVDFTYVVDRYIELVTTGSRNKFQTPPKGWMGYSVESDEALRYLPVDEFEELEAYKAYLGPIARGNSFGKLRAIAKLRAASTKSISI